MIEKMASNRRTAIAIIILITLLSAIVIVFGADTTDPIISFVEPTEDNNSVIFGTSTIINTTITEVNLTELYFNWNGINYTVMNGSLLLGLNFNNNSDIGETSSLAVDISSYGNNGTITNASWNTNGKYDGGISFDGDGDIVSCGNISGITNEFSIG